MLGRHARVAILAAALLEAAVAPSMAQPGADALAAEHILATDLLRKAACGTDGMTAKVLEAFIQAGKITSEHVGFYAEEAFDECEPTANSDILKVLRPHLMDVGSVSIAAPMRLLNLNLTDIRYPGGNGTTALVPIEVSFAEIDRQAAFFKNPAGVLASLTPEEAGQQDCLGQSYISRTLHMANVDLIDLALKRGLITTDTRVLAAPNLHRGRGFEPIYDIVISVRKVFPQYNPLQPTNVRANRLTLCPLQHLRAVAPQTIVTPLALILREIGKSQHFYAYELARFIAPLCKLGIRAQPDALHLVLPTLVKQNNGLSLIDQLVECGADIDAKYEGETVLGRTIRHQLRGRKISTDQLVSHLIGLGGAP